jgi:hypothetical protein
VTGENILENLRRLREIWRSTPEGEAERCEPTQNEPFLEYDDEGNITKIGKAGDHQQRPEPDNQT